MEKHQGLSSSPLQKWEVKFDRCDGDLLVFSRGSPRKFFDPEMPPPAVCVGRGIFRELTFRNLVILGQCVRTNQIRQIKGSRSGLFEVDRIDWQIELRPGVERAFRDRPARAN